MRPAALIAISLAVVVIAGTAQAGPAADPSWSSVMASIDKPIGSYRKQTTLTKDGDHTVIGEEFVDFDLKAKWLDRRITRAGSITGTRDRPALQFIYRPGYALMWNPNVADKCGTPWVKFTAKSLREQTGSDVNDAFVVEPADALAAARSKPRVVFRDASAATYRVLVSGDTGIPLSSGTADKTDILARLHRGTTTALVRVPRARTGPIRVAVDVTKAIEELGQMDVEDAKAQQVWSFERPPHKLDRTLPKKVSDSSCMG